MNQEDFITAVRMAVHDRAIEGVKAQLTQPPGRKPYEKIKELSVWFNALPESDKVQITEVIRLSVHATIFSMLCVFDGVTAIESTPEKGELRLIFIKDGKHTHLNDPEVEMLHDRYQSQIQVEVFGKDAQQSRIRDK